MATFSWVSVLQTHLAETMAAELNHQSVWETRLTRTAPSIFWSILKETKVEDAILWFQQTFDIIDAADNVSLFDNEKNYEAILARGHLTGGAVDVVLGLYVAPREYQCRPRQT